MGDSEEGNIDMMHRLKSSFGTSSSVPKPTHSISQLNIPELNTSQLRAEVRPFSPNFGEGNKRVGIPPSHPQMPPISPYSHMPAPRGGNQQLSVHNFTQESGPSHTRSLSQPSFFSFDSLPPMSPSSYGESSETHVSVDVSMEDRDGNLHSSLPPSPFSRGNHLKVGESLPPRKAHRRSNSDIPFGFSTIMRSSPPLIPLRGPGIVDHSASARDNMVSEAAQLLKRQSHCDEVIGDNNAEGMVERKSEGEVVDDLFSAYMNLDNLEALNSSGIDNKQGLENCEDSKASGTKTNGDSSDNEATSINESDNSMQRPGISYSAQKREGLKRNAGDDITPTSRHYRSISMDSFIGYMSFGDEPPNMPPPPGARPGQLSPSTSFDDNSNNFSLEFGNGEFSSAELKKIMANEQLSEIALSDPKRAKRILANRQSASRSKERKMHYISELEHKVQILQTEATTLSAQLTLLQRDSSGLTNQNNELKFWLQAMKQQAQLRDALNEALTAEVQRLKIATAAMGGEAAIFQQLSLNSQMFELHQQQSNQLNMHQVQQQQKQLSQSKQNGSSNTKHEST